jgi:AcrR family transcriptional regulator
MLASEGYAGFRLETLASRAGVAKTTILRRWPTKSAVAAAAIERLALDYVAPPPSDTLQAELRVMLSNAVEVFTRGAGTFVPRLIRESGHDSEIAELLHKVIDTRRLAYRRVLNRAIARDELNPDVDIEMLIDLLIGPIWTRLLITRAPITPMFVDGIIDVITRAYLHDGGATRKPVV